MTARAWLTAAVITCIAPACTDVEGGLPSDDEHGVALPNGKADSPWGACASDAILLWVNDASEDAQTLRAAGVNSRAASRIIATRDGADGEPGTDDDALFGDIEALDAVSWVGPRTFEQLNAATAEACDPTWPQAEVILSPQPWETSHVARAEALIEDADRTIDIAMYSFRITSIREALGRAIDRGVKVRFIFESAGDDRKNPDGTVSAALEDLGIDVRYVNKIMHHKFMLVDGPQTHLSEALGATLLTGSANWSSSAATRYDENTVIITGAPELNLAFQREFNHLWAHSRDFVWNDQLVHWESMPIPEDAVVDSAAFDTAFTSDNFQLKWSNTYGHTFSVVRGRNAVADRLVAMIEGAESSILIASGHMRSRPVADALYRKMLDNPELVVRAYFDGQEFISAGSQQYQEQELDECVAAAGASETKRADCYDNGYYFSYELHLAGASVRFKHYAFRWHYSYAPQMHHKYIVVDGSQVATGSYNLSDNAEHNTMENMIFFDAGALPDVVSAFINNFEAMWLTGEAEGLYEALVAEISNGKADVPLVYPAMALPWEQVDELKALIRETCGDVDDEDHRRRPESHRTCTRK